MAGYNMMYSYKRVIFFIFLLILALTVTHVVKTPDVVALSSISGKNDHKTRIFLFRHGERCDRSDNLCLSDADGITLLGAEQAVNNGEMFNARVSDYEVYSTDTNRTDSKIFLRQSGDGASGVICMRRDNF